MTLATNCVERVCHIHRAAPERNGAERNHWVQGIHLGMTREGSEPHGADGTRNAGARPRHDGKKKRRRTLRSLLSMRARLHRPTQPTVPRIP
jgi:hypothetical protein